jgi:hypothetical protein
MGMALAKGATMSRRLEALAVEAHGEERSLNLDAIRVSLQEAAAVLAEMADVDTSTTPGPPVTSSAGGPSSSPRSRHREAVAE